MTESTLNSQMVDSVAAMNFINNGSSPASSQAMLNAVMAEALGMAMHNAVMRQQSSSMVSSAATTAACAKMLQTRSGGLPPKPHMPLVPIPDIPPLDGPPDSAVAVAAATVQADRAIHSLEAEVKKSQQTEAKASSALSGIAEAIKNFVSKPPEQPASGSAGSNSPVNKPAGPQG